MESRMQKIWSRKDKRIALKVYKGHFATPNSHISHYFDMTTLKTRASEARAVAQVLAQKYSMSTVVDTIVCMDEMQIVGAYLAEELSAAGIMSVNLHQTIYVISPEFNSSGQIMFRDNLKMMLENKNVIILMASATTGKTLQACVNSILYYGGKVAGISCIFSTINKLAGVDVNYIFHRQDVPHYQSYKPIECPLCREGHKIDALVNGYGYSKI